MADIYPPLVQKILAGASPAPLGRGQPYEPAGVSLETLRPSELFDQQVVDSSMAACCLSGILTLFGHWRSAHEVSQDIASPTGSFWHAIQHRREPDPGNAGYWFAQVGDHPTFPDILQAACEAAPEGPWSAWNEWQPRSFVSACNRALGQGGSEEAACVAAQHAEWTTLFHYCYRKAIEN